VPSRTKVLFLYTTPSPYFSSCLKYLATLPKVEVQVVFKNTTHLLFKVPFINHGVHGVCKPQTFQELLSLCVSFRPNIIFISGWIDKEYLQIGRLYKKKGITIIGLSDTLIKRNVRQYLGKWYSRWYLKNIFTAFWVSGKKAEDLIRYLGWENQPVFHGFYTIDHLKFYPLSNQIKTPSFLFVGRLEKIKGVEILIAAYQWYRSIVQKPWTLKIAGTGSLQKNLPHLEGIQYMGHLDNSKLANIYHQSACFILPSLHEPWGVVIHEAAASGLPLILSKNCGAKELFLQPNVNGWIWENKDFKSLGALMIKVHFTSKSKLERYGKKSHELSLHLHIQYWLNTFATIKSL
jgi:glycosyltransferase involved in cell wall biosynthesis